LKKPFSMPMKMGAEDVSLRTPTFTLVWAGAEEAERSRIPARSTARTGGMSSPFITPFRARG
jgi:hypothetical protein